MLFALFSSALILGALYARASASALVPAEGEIDYDYR